jgi:hypothetical protein
MTLCELPHLGGRGNAVALLLEGDAALLEIGCGGQDRTLAASDRLFPLGDVAFAQGEPATVGLVS